MSRDYFYSRYKVFSGLQTRSPTSTQWKTEVFKRCRSASLDKSCIIASSKYSAIGNNDRRCFTRLYNTLRYGCLITNAHRQEDKGTSVWLKQTKTVHLDLQNNTVPFSPNAESSLNTILPQTDSQISSKFWWILLFCRQKDQRKPCWCYTSETVHWLGKAFLFVWEMTRIRPHCRPTICINVKCDISKHYSTVWSEVNICGLIYLSCGDLWVELTYNNWV